MLPLNRAPRIALAGLALAGLSLTLAPRTAEACGGTFCDNTGGPPMPVDQTGEDILFVRDGPSIEAHVRIEYEGEAERFAWIVPLQAVPEVSVGSEPLFNQLAGATAPSWRATRDYQCPDEEPGGDEGGVFVPASDFANASEPDILLEETVGAFEVVVLQSGDANELIDFLIANDYAQDPEAAPIIQEYLDEGFLFAAVKLTAGVDVDAIHPLVFRVTSDEPCVPIRLTRIAAEEDMGIRAYFLGAERWAPQNYPHVVLNTLGFPWSQAPTSSAGLLRYNEQLGLAVDEAGGRAFATDYAGPSNAVPNGSGIYSPAWDEGPFVFADPVGAIDLIIDQGLNTHPLIQPLLMRFIPPPDGVPANQFWSNIGEFQDQIDLAAWDGPAFAAALAEQIIEPGLHASDLLEAWPYLTRLNTIMSPHEMLVDPTFQPAPSLGLVDNVVTAEGLDFCGEGTGDRYLVPWSGQQVPVCRNDEDASEWPLADLPAALRVEEIPMVGPAQVIEDNSAEIAAAWQAHQATTACAGDPGGDDGGTDTGMDTGGDEAGDGETGPGLDDEGGDAKAGCACSSDPSGPAGLAFALFGLAGVLLASRRPRRRA